MVTASADAIKPVKSEDPAVGKSLRGFLIIALTPLLGKEIATAVAELIPINAIVLIAKWGLIVPLGTAYILGLWMQILPNEGVGANKPLFFIKNAIRGSIKEGFELVDASSHKTALSDVRSAMSKANFETIDTLIQSNFSLTPEDKSRLPDLESTNSQLGEVVELSIPVKWRQVFEISVASLTPGNCGGQSVSALANTRLVEVLIGQENVRFVMPSKGFKSSFIPFDKARWDSDSFKTKVIDDISKLTGSENIDENQVNMLPVKIKLTSAVTTALNKLKNDEAGNGIAETRVSSCKLNGTLLISIRKEVVSK